MASSSTNSTFLPGFGFCPNNSEIVTLLKNKEANSTLNVEYCKDIDFYNHEPEDLPTTNSGDEKMYYFTHLKSKHTSGGVINRQTPRKGSWRMTGSFKEIKDESGKASAEENSFTYHKVNGEKTQWLMKEYTLLKQNKISQWAFCVVYHKRSPKTK